MLGGIYQIREVVTAQRYVGRTTSFVRREAEHKKRLRAGQHKNRHLQNAWNKYGPDRFAFEPLIECSLKEALIVEQLFLDGKVGEFNIARDARTPVAVGEKRDPAVVEKMAASKRGKRLPQYRCEQISCRLIGNSFRRGIPHTAEVCARFSETRRGRKHSPETREKMSATAAKRPRDEKGRLLSWVN